jgi:hypothetical protein
LRSDRPKRAQKLYLIVGGLSYLIRTRPGV